jgi:hypothetical protein
MDWNNKLKISPVRTTHTVHGSKYHIQRNRTHRGVRLLKQDPNNGSKREEESEREGKVTMSKVPPSS